MKIGNSGQAEIGALMSIWLVFILIMFILSIAMENPRTLFWGGKLNIDVEPGGKVLFVQPHMFHNVWVMTRPMSPKEQPDVIILREKSWFGIFQGTIIVRESR